LSPAITELYLLEARVWLYALFSKNKNFEYAGQKYFSYHSHNGNASNQQGFLFIILFELPIVHFILHMAWSPTVAYWVSGLTLYGLVFMYADYKASLMRPISIDNQNLIIRYGVWGNQTIPISYISKVTLNSKPIKRSKQHLRFCQFGAPNICIHIDSCKHLSTPFSSQSKQKIYLGLDNPSEFIDHLRHIVHIGDNNEHN